MIKSVFVYILSAIIVIEPACVYADNNAANRDKLAPDSFFSSNPAQRVQLSEQDRYRILSHVDASVSSPYDRNLVLEALGIVRDGNPEIDNGRSQIFLQEENDRFVYDKDMKKTFLKKLKYEKGLCMPEDEEFPELYKEVNEIFQRLLSAAGIQAELYLADKEDANAAAAVYFNFVIINTGLFRMLKKEGVLTKDLIAFILAHEIVHLIQHREDLAAGAGVKIGSKMSVEDLLKKKYQKRQDSYAREYDADTRALKFVNDAGYNLMVVTQFFEKIVNDTEDRFRKLLSIMFDEHPDPKDRIRNLIKIRQSANWKETSIVYDFGRGVMKEIEKNKSGYRAVQSMLREISSLESIEKAIGQAESVEELDVIYGYSIEAAVDLIAEKITPPNLPSMEDARAHLPPGDRSDFQKVLEVLKKMEDELRRTYGDFYDIAESLRRKHMVPLGSSSKYYNLERFERKQINGDSPCALLKWMTASYILTGKCFTNKSSVVDIDEETERLAALLSGRQFQDVINKIALLRVKLSERIEYIAHKNRQGEIKAFIFGLGFETKFERDDFNTKQFSDAYYKNKCMEFLSGKSNAELRALLEESELFYGITFDSTEVKDGYPNGYMLSLYGSYWKEFNAKLFQVFIEVLAEQIIATSGEPSLEELLSLAELFSRKHNTFLLEYGGSPVLPFGRLIDFLIKKMEDSDSFRPVLSLLLKHDILHSYAGGYIYEQLLKDQNNPKMWELVNKSEVFRESVVSEYRDAIREGRDARILFFNDYTDGKLTETFQRLYFTDRFTHESETEMIEEDALMISRDLMKRHSGSQKKQAEVWRNFLEAYDNYRVFKKKAKPLNTDEVYSAYWDFVRGMDGAFLRDEAARIARQYDLVIPEGCGRDAFELIYFIYNGGVFNVIDFRKRTKWLFDKRLNPEEYKFIARFLNHPAFIEKQYKRNILMDFSADEMEGETFLDKRGDIYAHRVYEKTSIAAASADSLITKNAFYKMYTWEEYILFYNLIVWLMINGNDKMIQTLFEAMDNPETFSMFFGEIMSGNVDILYPDILREVVEENRDVQAVRKLLELDPSGEDTRGKKARFKSLEADCVYEDYKTKCGDFSQRMKKRFESILTGLIFGVPRYLNRQDIAINAKDDDAIDFIKKSNRPFGELLAEIKQYLPRSVFRNYVLWTVFIREMRRIYSAAEKNLFKNPQRLQRWIEDREGRGENNSRIYEMILIIAPLLTHDNRLDFINSALLEFIKNKQIRKGDSTGIADFYKADLYYKHLRVLGILRLIFGYFVLKILYGYIKRQKDAWHTVNLYASLAEIFLSQRNVLRMSEPDIDYYDAQIRNHVREVFLAFLHKENPFLRYLRGKILLLQKMFLRGRIYTDFLFFGYDEKLTHIDICAGNLTKKRLEDMINSASPSFQEKLDEIRSFFPKPSPSRDYFLEMLAEHERSRLNDGGEELFRNLKPLSGEFHNSYFKERYNLIVMTLDEELHPDEFDSMEKKISKAEAYFESGYTRDDILLTFLEEARMMRECELIKPKLYQYKGDVLEKKTAKRVFSEDRIFLILEGLTPVDRKQLLLWLLDAGDKPLFLEEVEISLGVNYNRLREMFNYKHAGRYEHVGESFKRRMLEELFLGEHGIFSNYCQFQDFKDALFETYVPKGRISKKTLRIIFDAVFEYSDEMKKLDIIQALSNTMLSDGIKGETEVIKDFFSAAGFIGVKIGQIIAHAPDIDLSTELRNALKELSSRADPLSKMAAFESIQHLYPGGFDENFEYLGEQLGSASIKVVFRARKKGADRDIALKIKRPKVDQLIEQELTFLRNVLGSLRKKGLAVPVGLEDQVSGALSDDVDFDLESEIVQKFAAQLDKMAAEEKYKLRNGAGVAISVAPIYRIISGKIMEADLAQGASFDNLDKLINSGNFSGDELNQIKKIIFDYLMEQIFVYGFYNADPHGGNFHVYKENGMIKVVFIDTGSAESVNLAKGEVELLLESLLWLKIVPDAPVPRRFLYTSVVFKKMGYLMEGMSAEDILTVIMGKLAKRNIEIAASPKAYIRKLRRKFLFELSGVPRVIKKYSPSASLARARNYINSGNLQNARRLTERILEYRPENKQASALLDTINFKELSERLSINERQLMFLLGGLDGRLSEEMREKLLALVKNGKDDISDEALREGLDIFAVNISFARSVIAGYPDFIKQKHRKEAVKRIALFLTIRKIKSGIDERNRVMEEQAKVLGIPPAGVVSIEDRGQGDVGASA